jgi:hypothetical protein
MKYFVVQIHFWHQKHDLSIFFLPFLYHGYNTFIDTEWTSSGTKSTIFVTLKSNYDIHDYLVSLFENSAVIPQSIFQWSVYNVTRRYFYCFSQKTGAAPSSFESIRRVEVGLNQDKGAFSRKIARDVNLSPITVCKVRRNMYNQEKRVLRKVPHVMTPANKAFDPQSSVPFNR